jgi:hypothetical protein
LGLGGASGGEREDAEREGGETQGRGAHGAFHED